MSDTVLLKAERPSGKMDDEQGKLYKGMLISSAVLADLRKLQKKNNWYNFFSIGLDWFLIAAAIGVSLYIGTIWMYLLAVCVIAGRMRGLDNLMHEASHNMLFKTKSLNRWIGFLFVALPVCTNFNMYCTSHYKHHRFLWTDDDPDTVALKKLGLHQSKITKAQFLLKYIFGSFLIANLFDNIKTFIHKLITNEQQTKLEYGIKLVFWAALIGSSVIFGFWLQLILYWLIPLLFIFPIIRFWSDLADHSGLETLDPLYSSRNSYGNFLERFFLYPHHDTYHIVHHLFPAIPHYNLKQAHITLMSVPDYARAHHCTGFVASFFPGFRSVIDDIVRLHRSESKRKE